MKFTLEKSQLRTLQRDDPKFIIQDGLVTCPRAGFEISKDCPVEYRLILQECINFGWIKPVAYVTERELIFMGLTK